MLQGVLLPLSDTGWEFGASFVSFASYFPSHVNGCSVDLETLVTWNFAMITEGSLGSLRKKPVGRRW